MQNDLCRDARRKDKADKMIPLLLSAIKLFSDRKALIVYSTFALPPEDEQFDRFGDRYCVEGTEGANIIPELLPLRGPVIEKKKHSAFFKTELDKILRKNGVEEIFLAGLQTHICILTTAADASFRGYKPIAIEECVLSTRDENNSFALDWISKYVGEVRNLREISTMLEKNGT